MGTQGSPARDRLSALGRGAVPHPLEGPRFLRESSKGARDHTGSFFHFRDSADWSNLKQEFFIHVIPSVSSSLKQNTFLAGSAEVTFGGGTARRPTSVIRPSLGARALARPLPFPRTPTNSRGAEARPPFRVVVTVHYYSGTVVTVTLVTQERRSGVYSTAGAVPGLPDPGPCCPRRRDDAGSQTGESGPAALSGLPRIYPPGRGCRRVGPKTAVGHETAIAAHLSLV